MRAMLIEYLIAILTMVAFVGLCFLLATNIGNPLGYYGMVALGVLTLAQRLDHIMNLIRLPIAFGVHGVANRIG